ncbi:MAG: hemerythrin domain-containing protein [Pseudomonadota bacterium]
MPGTTPPRDGGDMLAQLQAGHARVSALLRAFERIADEDDEDPRKAELIDDLCYELTIHGMLDEELFYPALRAVIDNDELLDDAEQEHAGIRELVSQLEVMYPGDEHFRTTVAVLTEEVEHHLAMEERELFEAARLAGIDLEALGARLLARREELDGDLSAPPAPSGSVETGSGQRRAPHPPDQGRN